MEEQTNPAPPEILVERDRLVTRLGNHEIVVTKDGITVRTRSELRPDSLSTPDET